MLAMQNTVYVHTQHHHHLEQIIICIIHSYSLKDAHLQPLMVRNLAPIYSPPSHFLNRPPSVFAEEKLQNVGTLAVDCGRMRVQGPEQTIYCLRDFLALPLSVCVKDMPLSSFLCSFPRSPNSLRMVAVDLCVKCVGAG